MVEPDEATIEEREPLGDGPAMDPAELEPSLEALLLMAEEPLPAATMADSLEVELAEVTDALARLADFYRSTNRGFVLRNVGGGWRYYTRPDRAPVLTRYVLDGQQSKLSQAALETLAVIAYLQPISRTRVSAVRGVSVDGVVRTLITRGLIEEAGQDEQSGAVVFRTTDFFLERMGLRSLTDLPDLAPHLPEAAELEAELAQLVAEAPGPDVEAPLDEAPADPGSDPAAGPSPDRPVSPPEPEASGPEHREDEDDQ